MAIYHFTTNIIRASKGKCAVAAAAYQAADKLYDERLGQSFAYTHKEEVVHAEIMLPNFAPAHLNDRETLWNEVEKIQSKSNSRYARQFEFSLPIEWSHEECIERARDFINKNFVDKGMVVDWAYHEKTGNPHIHMLCTVRGFNPDGTWAPISKSVYKLDENGNKIPDIDPATRLQKVRIRKGKGEEKLWLRVNNPTNDWNKRETLIGWRKSWAQYANQFLEEENKIDHRSYQERGIEKIPGVHISPGMNELSLRGGVSYQVQENMERKRINDFFEKAKFFIEQTRKQIAALKNIILRRDTDEERRSIGKETDNRRIDTNYNRLSGDSTSINDGAENVSERIGFTEGLQEEGGASRTKASRRRH